MIESIQAISAASRLSGIQAARGFAAIAVVATHAMFHHLETQEGLRGLPGVYGVSLFFVISGFIMVRTTGSARFDPRRFMIRRIKRIVPLYYVACGALAVVAMIPGIPLRSTTLTHPIHILKSLLFIPDYAPRQPNEIHPFLKAGWTLNMEMFFYLVFACLFFLSAKARIWIITSLFLFLICLGQITTIPTAVPKFYTYPIIAGFVAGMWLASIHLPENRRLTSRLAIILSLLSVCSMAGIIHFYDLMFIREVPMTAWLVATVSIQLAVVVFYVDRGGIGVPNWLIALGDASYSIYLFHMFALGLALTIALRAFPTQLTLAMVWAATAGTICGLIVHRTIEKPLTSWLNRVRRA